MLGHSIGAVLAMTLALQRPDVVDRLVLAAAGSTHPAVPDIDLDDELSGRLPRSPSGPVAQTGKGTFPSSR